MLDQNNEGMQKPRRRRGLGNPDELACRIHQPDEARITDLKSRGRVVRSEIAPLNGVSHAVEREDGRAQRGEHARQRDDRRPRAIAILLSRRKLDRIGERAVTAPCPPQRLQVRAGSERLAELVRERPDVETG